jgi:hypothetical protein
MGDLSFPAISRRCPLKDDPRSGPQRGTAPLVAERPPRAGREAGPVRALHGPDAPHPPRAAGGLREDGPRRGAVDRDPGRYGPSPAIRTGPRRTRTDRPTGTVAGLARAPPKRAGPERRRDGVAGRTKRHVDDTLKAVRPRTTERRAHRTDGDVNRACGGSAPAEIVIPTLPGATRYSERGQVEIGPAIVTTVHRPGRNTNVPAAP